MKTSRQVRRTRRINNAVALFCVLTILTFASVGVYFICGLITFIIWLIFAILVIFNFPWYKFK